MPRQGERGAPKLVSERIYADMRRRILAGDLRPGERLVLRRLAAHYGASEIPVREALRMLQQEHLVKVTAHAGALVARLSVEEVYEALVIRSRLEGLATEAACPNLTTADLRRLRALLERLRDAADNDDIARYAQLNRTFHDVIFRRCPYTLLLQLIDGLRRNRDLVFRSDTMQQSITEHVRLVECLAAGDAVEAGRVAEAHKLRAGRSLEGLLAHPRRKARAL